MKKIGISTLSTGYNYGSMLQATAVKQIVEQLGYQGEIIRIRGSVVHGRDIRLGKMIKIAMRLALRPKDIMKTVQSYRGNTADVMSMQSMDLFDRYQHDYLLSCSCSYHALKGMAKSDQYVAFICGSDQIWSSTNYYVDPVYYLRFVPREKRIALAPSLGHDYIASYNRHRMKKYIGEISYCSVREQSGVSLIRELTGIEPTVLLDPTLVLHRSEWLELLALQSSCSAEKQDYLLAYFLNEPTERAKQMLRALKQQLNCDIVALPYQRKESDWFDRAESAGPKEFVQFVSQARFICTDSFHGTAFALKFEIPFFVFERDYQTAIPQSTRIASLLALTGHEDRFDCAQMPTRLEMDFNNSNCVLEQERERTYAFLTQALENIQGGSSVASHQ